MVRYTIYQTTNLINGKKYIGKHSTSNPDDAYLGSGNGLRKAIRKYGVENFSKTVLFDFDTEEEMNQKEIELVTIKEVKSQDYYNQSTGGQGGRIVLYPDHPKYNQTILKISEAAKNRSAEISERMKILHQQKITGMHGKKHSDKTKKKMAATATGPKPWLVGIAKSPETRKKISEAHKGKIYSEETKARISKNHHNFTGENNPMFGKKHSEESRKKQSESAKQRPKVTCPHCNKTGDKPVMTRYHFDKCKVRDVQT